jgi:hypothetical protein
MMKTLVPWVDPSACQQVLARVDRDDCPRSIAPEVRLNGDVASALNGVESELEAADFNLVLSFWESQLRKWNHRPVRLHLSAVNGDTASESRRFEYRLSSQQVQPGLQSEATSETWEQLPAGS